MKGSKTRHYLAAHSILLPVKCEGESRWGVVLLDLAFLGVFYPRDTRVLSALLRVLTTDCLERVFGRLLERSGMWTGTTPAPEASQSWAIS